MLDHIFHVSLRALNILLQIELGPGCLRIPALFLQNERDRMQRVHIGKTFSAHRVKKLADSKLSPEEIVTELYLSSFSRFSTQDELKRAVSEYVLPNATRQSATEDVLWALLNSAEFVFNH